MVWINNKYETLGSTSDTMDATSMTASQFGVFLNHAIPDSNSTQTRYTVNGVSSGSKYASRQSKIGMTDVLAVSQDEVIYDSGGETDDKFSVTYACDIAGEEKLFIGFGISRKEAGGGNAPTRSEVVWKYVTTSARVTSVRDDTSAQTGTYAVGSNLSCLSDIGASQVDRDQVTDVPAGTRFEETDTRKIYRYDNAVTLQEGGWSGTLDDAIVLYSYQGGGVSGVYVQINSGSALVGMNVSRVGLQIIRHSTTNSYPACVGVWDSSNLPDHTASDKGAKHVFAEFNINQLSQGYVDEPSFGVDGDHDTGCDGEYTLQAGDYLGVSAHQGSGATVICQVKASYDGDKFDGTNTQIAFHQGAQSSFTNMADGGEDDMYIKIYGKAGWVERGVAV